MANRFTNYYRNRLPDDVQKNIYDSLCSNWNGLQRKTSFRNFHSPSFDMNTVVSAAAHDHPELFWVDYYRYTETRSPAITSLAFRFFYPDTEITLMRREAEEWKNRVSAQVDPSLPLNQKIWMVYDYLARQVTYGNADRSESHTIAGVFKKQSHIAVCEGIAKSCKFLCNALDIPCIVVSGHADFGIGHRGPHAWNIVCSENGCLRHIDITAELTMARLRGMARTDSFMCTDREMNEYRWDRTLIPQCV